MASWPRLAHLDEEAAIVELARDHVHVAAAQEDPEALRAAARNPYGVLQACSAILAHITRAQQRSSRALTADAR